MGLISRVSSRTYRKKFGTRPNKNRTMAVGKNKRLNTKSKKGGKKKVVDPFIKKEWFDVKAPNMFKQRNIGKTLVTKTIGNKVAADGLKHRVYDINQEDLQGQDGNHFRKFRLVCEDVQGQELRDGQEEAHHDQRPLRRQDHRQLPAQALRRRLHRQGPEAGQGNHLLPVPPG